MGANDRPACTLFKFSLEPLQIPIYSLYPFLPLTSPAEPLNELQARHTILVLQGRLTMRKSGGQNFFSKSVAGVLIIFTATGVLSAVMIPGRTIAEVPFPSSTVWSIVTSSRVSGSGACAVGGLSPPEGAPGACPPAEPVEAARAGALGATWPACGQINP
jgi:hypothetical protein